MHYFAFRFKIEKIILAHSRATKVTGSMTGILSITLHHLKPAAALAERPHQVSVTGSMAYSIILEHHAVIPLAQWLSVERRHQNFLVVQEVCHDDPFKPALSKSQWVVSFKRFPQINKYGINFRCWDTFSVPVCGGYSHDYLQLMMIHNWAT